MKSESVKTARLFDQFAALRMVVGYLGQRRQLGWWDCDFLDPTGIHFLEAILPRTARAAALRSTSGAASIVHDKAVGRVGTYHLFRFPPSLEDRIEHAVDLLDWAVIGKQIESRAAAMEALKKYADNLIKAPEGPVQVGVERRIVTSTSIRELAAHYHSAFRDGFRCFPYFAPEKDAR